MAIWSNKRFHMGVTLSTGAVTPKFMHKYEKSYHVIMQLLKEKKNSFSAYVSFD